MCRKSISVTISQKKVARAGLVEKSKQLSKYWYCVMQPAISQLSCKLLITTWSKHISPMHALTRSNLLLFTMYPSLPDDHHLGMHVKPRT